MKYLAVLFWAVVLGQVAGFIGSALTHAQYDPIVTLIVSVIFGVIISLVPAILANSSPKHENK
ncbi:YjzD family protein [Lactobacillus sp. YT155]|uniref:YjzD family protein n=1 Tax=Lactobacillus sp. YT155 TaxID=3060955 RepID=UPI00265F9D94|nr:YjzD family protein [Lactobacillus sp. YT155]MDO1605369.1 YjzD family protein [Lactobacillus sp. YT155]